VALEREGKLRARAGQSARIVKPGLKIIEKGKLGLVIRDSFTMPVADYELIGALKKRCIGLGVAIKKSELLWAGLATLQRQSDESLAQVVAAIESVKTGRPPGGKKKTKTKTKTKTNRTKGRKL
jgi:hypothetical protein